MYTLTVHLNSCFVAQPVLRLLTSPFGLFVDISLDEWITRLTEKHECLSEGELKQVRCESFAAPAYVAVSSMRYHIRKLSLQRMSDIHDPFREHDLNSMRCWHHYNIILQLTLFGFCASRYLYESCVFRPCLSFRNYASALLAYDVTAKRVFIDSSNGTSPSEKPLTSLHVVTRYSSRGAPFLSKMPNTHRAQTNMKNMKNLRKT